MSWHRHGWYVLLGYVVGFLAVLALWGWHPTGKREKTGLFDVPVIETSAYA